MKMIKNLSEPKKPKILDDWQVEDAARLTALFDDRAEPKLSQLEFGTKFEIGSQGMVWQYLSGRRPLNISSATAFALGLGVKIEQFSPTIAAQIKAASKLTELNSGVTYIQRTNEQESRLLDMYRLMDDEWKGRLIQAASGMPKLDLPLGSRNKG